MENKVTKRFTPIVIESDDAKAVLRYKTMPADRVQAELTALGIDPQPTIDAVRQIVAAAAAKLQEQEQRRPLHKTPPVMSDKARVGRVLNGNRRRSPRVNVPPLQPTSPWRGFFWCAGPAAPGAVFPWSATRCVADRLHHAIRHGAAAESKAVLHEAFEHLGAVAGELRTRCAADLDAAWPLAECLIETGIEVSMQAPLWPVFAGRFADLHSASPPALQGMLVHALRRLLATGAETAGLAARTAAEIVRRGPSPETHVLIVRLARRHDVLPGAVEGLPGAVDVATRDKVAVIDAAKHDALENFPRLRGRKAEKGFLGTRPVATLIEHLEGDPLSSFLAMDALSEVYHCAATLIVQDPKPRQKEQDAVFSDRVLQQLADPSGSCFLAAGSLELVRDEYPRFTALMAASLVERLPERGRTALFVCIAEGYERSFRGAKRDDVPHYELDGPPRFVTGIPHELDLFGERVTASPMADGLRPHMEWSNARLRRWMRNRDGS